MFAMARCAIASPLFAAACAVPVPTTRRLAAPIIPATIGPITRVARKVTSPRCFNQLQSDLRLTPRESLTVQCYKLTTNRYLASYTIPVVFLAFLETTTSRHEGAGQRRATPQSFRDEGAPRVRAPGGAASCPRPTTSPEHRLGSPADTRAGRPPKEGPASQKTLVSSWWLLGPARVAG